MRVEFIGVGDAFDTPVFGNSSFLIHSSVKLVIDCGFAAAPHFFARKFDTEFVDGFYFTHFHADHLFGLPAVLTQWCVAGRKKTLQIIGQRGIQARVEELLDLAYPSIRQRLPFELSFTESEDECSFGDLHLFFAQTDHPQKNLAVRITSSGRSIGISGDGRVTESSKRLLWGCDVIVHDAFTFNQPNPVHANACEVVECFQNSPGLKALAFVHLQTQEREERREEYLRLVERFGERETLVLCPTPGVVLSVDGNVENERGRTLELS